MARSIGRHRRSHRKECGQVDAGRIDETGRGKVAAAEIISAAMPVGYSTLNASVASKAPSPPTSPPALATRGRLMSKTIKHPLLALSLILFSCGFASAQNAKKVS